MSTRIQTIQTGALGALAAASLAFGFSAAQEENKDLEVLKGQISALESEVKDLRTFAEGQAEAGKELIEALEASEAAGFTAGINPKSREVLLEGLRGAAKAMEAGEGDEGAKKKSAPTSRRGRRRGK